ncbi:MAG: prepilin peptidase, partial [Candidatus Cloacimonetes bacterium]|nr:prepilin peptidase [Candidatus Cloacimonadota bacterium]
MNIVILILLAVIGAALGSFFNVIIYRLPRKQSIVYPPSHCGECNKPIPFYLNIPIASYIILRGKCKYCGASIHWHHFLVELLTPIILMLLFVQYGYDGQYMLFFKYSVLCLFLIPIFFIDAFHQIIPHKLSIPLIPLGLIFALIPGNDITILESGITAAIIFCFLVFIAYAYRFARKADGLGGGDIWLLTGISTFMGLISMPYLILVSA